MRLPPRGQFRWLRRCALQPRNQEKRCAVATGSASERQPGAGAAAASLARIILARQPLHRPPLRYGCSASLRRLSQRLQLTGRPAPRPLCIQAAAGRNVTPKRKVTTCRPAPACLRGLHLFVVRPLRGPAALCL